MFPCAPNHHLHLLQVQLVFGPEWHQSAQQHPSKAESRQCPELPHPTPAWHWEGLFQSPLLHAPLGHLDLNHRPHWPVLKRLVKTPCVPTLHPITQPQERATVVSGVTALPPRCGMSYPWREGERTPERVQPFCTLWVGGGELARSDGQNRRHGGCVLTNSPSTIFCPNGSLYPCLARDR